MYVALGTDKNGSVGRGLLVPQWVIERADYVRLGTVGRFVPGMLTRRTGSEQARGGFTGGLSQLALVARILDSYTTFVTPSAHSQLMMFCPTRGGHTNYWGCWSASWSFI
jgi:hypothetical protein